MGYLPVKIRGYLPNILLDNGGPGRKTRACELLEEMELLKINFTRHIQGAGMSCR